MCILFEPTCQKDKRFSSFCTDSATLTFSKSDWRKTMLTNFKEDSNSVSAEQALINEDTLNDKT